MKINYRFGFGSGADVRSGPDLSEVVMHHATRKALYSRISCGYVKPTRSEWRFLRANEGSWAVAVVTTGLYGEEIVSPVFTTFKDLLRRVVFTGSRPFVFRYFDCFSTVCRDVSSM